METVRATSDDERARGQVAKALAEGLVLDQPVRVLTREKLTLGRYVGSVEYWRGDGWEDLATTLRSRGAEKLPGDKAWAGPKPQPRG